MMCSFAPVPAISKQIRKCFWEISASCNPVKRANLDILRKPKKK